MKKRANLVLGYLRVSTEEQAASGLGLSDQHRVITNEANNRGWDLMFLSDEGFSAKNLARPGIATALDMLKRGDASTLVVSKLDRLSRSLLDFAGLMETARKQGWELVVLDLNVDTTTPSGSLMANVLASFAEYERQIIGHRTSAALQELKQQGVRLGRPVTLATEVRQRIVSERTAGVSLARIADGLAKDGIPTARGGKWHPSTIKAVLASVELDVA